jgi:hypothetical protein
LNNWGTSKWTCDGHVNDLIFLDLRISLDYREKLSYKTYQKEQNLYLYIPPESAHPKICYLAYSMAAYKPTDSKTPKQAG